MMPTLHDHTPPKLSTILLEVMNQFPVRPVSHHDEQMNEILPQLSVFRLHLCPWRCTHEVAPERIHIPHTLNKLDRPFMT